MRTDSHVPFMAVQAGTCPPKDYPEIKSEGILRMVTEYNQSGYYVAGDTIEGFQYELSQAISALSGLEVQTQLEMSLAEISNNYPITNAT